MKPVSWTPYCRGAQPLPHKPDLACRSLLGSKTLTAGEWWRQLLLPCCQIPELVGSVQKSPRSRSEHSGAGWRWYGPSSTAWGPGIHEGWSSPQTGLKPLVWPMAAKSWVLLPCCIICLFAGPLTLWEGFFGQIMFLLPVYKARKETEHQAYQFRHKYLFTYKSGWHGTT